MYTFMCSFITRTESSNQLKIDLLHIHFLYILLIYINKSLTNTINEILQRQCVIINQCALPLHIGLVLHLQEHFMITFSMNTWTQEWINRIYNDLHHKLID